MIMAALRGKNLDWLTLKRNDRKTNQSSNYYSNIDAV